MTKGIRGIVSSVASILTSRIHWRVNLSAHSNGSEGDQRSPSVSEWADAIAGWRVCDEMLRSHNTRIDLLEEELRELRTRTQSETRSIWEQLLKAKI